MAVSEDAPTRRADGWLDLPRHVWTDPSALGGSFPATIGTQVLTLTLTLPVADGVGGGQLQPPPIGTGVVPATVRPPSQDWGYLDGRLPRVQRLRLMVEAPEDLHRMKVVIEPDVVASWLELFLEWTTVWANDPQLREPVLLGYLRVVEDDAVHNVGHGATIALGVPIMSRPSAPLTIEQLAKAATHASARERLPLEHRLLLAAITSDDVRLAVIDAAAAVEVAMTSQLVTRLKADSVPADAIEALMASANGLSQVGKLFRKLLGPYRPGELPGKAFERLCRTRNAAAHEGIEPSDRSSIDVAVRIVDHISPLPR